MATIKVKATKARTKTPAARRPRAPAAPPVPILVGMSFGDDQRRCGVAYPPGTGGDPGRITRDQHLTALAGVVRGLARGGNRLVEASVYLLVPGEPVAGAAAWDEAWAMDLPDALAMALSCPPAGRSAAG